jgi:isopropylmalate/homocitrate/citramalate synthase
VTAVRICDVSPRDGLQNESRVFAAEIRAELCRRLLGAGLPAVEAASFVRADRVPQMASSEGVLSRLGPLERARCGALALNERGLDRALAAGLSEVHVAVMATDAFSRRNVNADVEACLAGAVQMAARARRAGLRVSAAISVAFGCPFEGAVDPGRVLSLAERLAAAEVDELILADTIGVAVPGAVGRLCSAVAELGLPFGVHLHNTRNTGYANAWAALGASATIFEASAGGIGGCPFAPRASGNIATEDLVYLLEGEGVATGVDLDALLAVVAWLEALLGRELPGQLLRAGRFPVVPAASARRASTGECHARRHRTSTVRRSELR